MRNRAVWMAVPLLLVAAGCGGGDEEAGPTDDEAAPETTAVDEPAAESTDEPAAEPADDGTDEPASEPIEEPATDSVAEPTADSAAEEPAVEPVAEGETFTGDADSEWCIAARDIELLSEQLDTENLNFADPDAVEGAYTSFLDAVDDARSVAPSEIAADVETTYDGFSQLAASLAAVDWNFLDADLSIIDDLDAEMTTAGDRIGDYNEQVCGIDQGDDTTEAAADDDSDFDPSAGTPREQMAVGLVELGFTEEEADCIIQNVDIATYLETNDNAVIVEAFEVCDIPLSRLVELGGG